LITLSNTLEDKRAAAEVRAGELLEQCRLLEGKNANSEAMLVSLRNRLLREGLAGETNLGVLMLRLRRSLRAIVRHALRFPPDADGL
jgi:hypothetical protein